MKKLIIIFNICIMVVLMIIAAICMGVTFLYFTEEVKDCIYYTDYIYYNDDFIFLGSTIIIDAIGLIIFSLDIVYCLEKLKDINKNKEELENG